MEACKHEFIRNRKLVHKINCRAFSLIEVMIGMALLAVAIASSFQLYISSQRLTRYINQRERAWQIAVQEIEGLRRMQFHHVLWLYTSGFDGYAYRFKGYDSAGNPLKGENAIVEAKGGRTQNRVETLCNNMDPYKKEYFDPMGLEEGWVRVYMRKIKMTSGAERDWAVIVKVIVYWRDGDIVYGGDTNFNGQLDWSENRRAYNRGKVWEYWLEDWYGYNNWNKILKAPVEIETVLAPVL